MMGSEPIAYFVAQHGERRGNGGIEGTGRIKCVLGQSGKREKGKEKSKAADYAE
jgi:hypothetical protein